MGDELEWLPAGRPVRVRGLHRHDRPVEQIGRGSRAAINLVGVHHAEIRRGDELAAPGYLEPSRILSVEVVGSADAPPSAAAPGPVQAPPGDGGGPRACSRCWIAMKPGRACRGSARSCWPSRSSRSTASRSSSARRARRRRSAAAGSSSPARAGIAVAIARRSSGSAACDRPSRSIACARPCPSSASRPGPSVGSRRWSGWPSTRSRPALAALADSGALVELPVGPRRTVRVLVEFAADLEDRVLRALGRLHAARPRQSAIPRVHLAAELPDLASDALVSGILERLEAPGPGRRRRPDRGAAGPRAEAQPGRAAAQAGAGRRDPRRRHERRPTPPSSPRRPAPGQPSSPTCSPCSATSNGSPRSTPASTWTSTSTPNSAARSANASPTAPP